jgi:hypothetical protein
MLGITLALALAARAAATLSTQNITPFPRSSVIVGAGWTTSRYGPPSNQSGDILPTVWADDGDQYTMIDDGGTDISVAGAIWRQSLAQITGTPPNIRFSHVGDPNAPPPQTFARIGADRSLWTGPLGPYYSSGLVAADHVFYATQELNWNWSADAAFAGLQGIAYSTDDGQHWTSANVPFPAPLGNLNWVIRGRGASTASATFMRSPASASLTRAR